MGAGQAALLKGVPASAPASNWSRSASGVRGSFRQAIGGLLLPYYAPPHAKFLTIPTTPGPEGAPRQTIQIAAPVFGYKSHIGIDRRHGPIRCWTVIDAAQQDSRSFAGVLDPENAASHVWADTAYRARRNLETLERRRLRERIQFRHPLRRSLSEQLARANASRARIRSGIEHVFAAQKHRMALFVRTIGIARVRVKTGMANLIHSFSRLTWLRARDCLRSGAPMNSSECPTAFNLVILPLLTGPCVHLKPRRGTGVSFFGIVPAT
ncbi:transposase [Teichococcus aestuarii]|nr:transposase [Pseudoroseomonas aestuarii]